MSKEVKDGKGDGKGRETQSASSLGLKGQQAHVWDAKVRSEVAAKKAIEERDVNSKEYQDLLALQAVTRQKIHVRVIPVRSCKKFKPILDDTISRFDL